MSAITTMIGCEMKKLDKTKPYSEIIGSTDGSKYDQNGVVFDHKGDELVKEEKPRIGRPPKEKAE